MLAFKIGFLSDFFYICVRTNKSNEFYSITNLKKAYDSY